MGYKTIEDVFNRATLEELLGETVPDGDRRHFAVHAERDNRAHWLSMQLCDVIEAATACAPWLRGEKKAAPPERLVSAAMRPGSDAEMYLTHRMMSLVRTLKVEQSIRTYPFVTMVLMMNKALDELEALFGIPEVGEARLHFSALIEYLSTAREKGHSQELFEKIVTEMAGAFLREWTKAYEHARRLENARLGKLTCDPFETAVIGKLNVIEDEVTTQSAGGKNGTVSLKVQRWVFEKWTVCKSHPAMCKGDVKSRRVLGRDIWEILRGEAREKGIKDYEHFMRVKETALQNHRRGLF